MERGGKTSYRTHNPRIQYEVSDLMDGGSGRRRRSTASWLYSYGLQDHVSDLVDGGQEERGQHLSYSSGVQDQVSDFVDKGQEGGGHTACRSYRVSDLVDRKR
jgi:hypothetical protein